MKRTAFIAFTVVTVVYLIVGAVVFHFVEGRKERTVKLNFASAHKAFLKSHTCVSPEALQEYVQLALESQAQGISVSSIMAAHATNATDVIDDDAHHTTWDMASSFLFCLTVITTIGYGSITPNTKGGQLFCVFYALFGIPLFATTLVGVGERLQIPLQKIKKGKAWCKASPERDSQLKTCVFLSTGILILIFIPSAIIANTEHWSFTESFYFCIITLTTVGFGDYVPGGRGTGNNLNYLYRIILAVWIMLGLSWIALILSEVASLLQNNIMRAARTTQSRLGDLEDIVRKKARETRERIAQKASSYRRRSANYKDRDKPTTPVDKLSPPFESQVGDHHYMVDTRPEPTQHKLEETRITGPDGHSTQDATLTGKGPSDLDSPFADIPGSATEERVLRI